MSSNLNASGFEGKEIQLETFSPNRETPSSNKLVDTVGEGFEFTDLLGDQLLSGGNRVDIRIDFSANSILFDFSESSPYTRTSSGTFNGYVFTDVSGTIPEISNVTIDETITNLGLDSSDITFTEDSIEVNVEGLSFNTDTIAKLDVEFGGTLANAQIKGTVWNDLNDDGVLDSGEQGQAEVQIYLDTNNNGVLDADEPVTTTDESGKYEFTSLEPGTYIVREVIPQRFKQTFPLGSNTNIGDSFADVVLESFNSATGEPFPNETDVLGDTSDFVSLTKDSFITVEFTDETLIDSPGNDLFIEEEGSASEKAEVFVSSDAQEFVFLGTADGGTVTEFDLSTISFTEPVKAVKIVGLDNLGSAPGFDVESIQVLPDSIASPDFYSVDVAEGETVENINFGNTRGNPLEVIISAPRSIAANGTDEITVTYRNVGDTEIAAPLLNLEATGGLFRPGLEREFSDSEVQFLGINNQGVPGVLPPGASNTFTVEFIPDAASGDTINFSVSTINPDETIDWESLRASLKPSNLTEEAWNPIYDNFIAETGTTAGDYQQLLIKNANYFAEIGEYVADADRLVGFEFQQASDYQALTQRNSLGSFGVGGGFLGDIRVVVDEDGNVSIVSPGTSRGFSIQDDGSYLAAPGDFGTLSLVEGRYTLTSQSGTVTEFLADGQLDFIEDTNGNRLTAEYTEGSLLTGLVASNGDSLTFTRNDDGLITSVADSLGNITTYTYDGNLLTTVSTPEGTISYTYNDANAVSSITDANGTQVSFEYDSRGRLIKESVNAGAEEITYSYGENGEVTVTDSSGASSNFLLNDFGQVAQVTDSLDRTVDIDYDELGNPITITAPDGSRLGLGYDSAGNVTSQIDPLGHITTFSYEPNFNFLDTVTDPRGNTLDYDYDESGNLTTITYADGSKETFAYDAEGNVTQSVNRRGQGIDYQYNNRSQLLNQANADGSATGYIYDERGNLVSATDASGTTTLEYDADDRLTKITYGNGRSLAYTYDAGGRRTSMTDGNGNQVNYSYDAVGRLAGLTDGDGNAIVTYSYDDVGRLVREDNGNGTYTTYTYDLAGQVTSINNFAADDSVNSSYQYSYDELGQQTGVTTLDGSWSYSYDATGQLTGAVFTSTNADIADQNLSYEYDAAGNRIRTIVNGETTNYSANNLNQYETAGSVVYDYDADGNLISKTEGENTETYEYNNENRLVRVVDSAANETLYEYDVLGNRTATVYNGDRTEYVVDPFGFGDVVAEYNDAGELVANYTHGIGLVSRSDANGGAFYDSNAIGSTVGLTDASGNEVNSYSYLPFGRELTETEAIANPFEFVGQWGVMEERNGLDFMRARFYESQSGRFISADPIGIAGQDANLYRYATNNPNQIADPQGTLSLIPWAIRAGWQASRRWLLGTAGVAATGVALDTAYKVICGQKVTIEGVSRGFISKILRSGIKDISEEVLWHNRGRIKLKNPLIVGSIFITREAGMTFLNKVITGEDLSISNDDLAKLSITAIFPEIGGHAGQLGTYTLQASIIGCGNLSPENLSRIKDNLAIYKNTIKSHVTQVYDTDTKQSLPIADSNIADTKGEPHLRTFDGVGYDFQGAGEFTLVKSNDSDLNIQIRYVQIDSRVTVATAVATEIEGQKVVIDSEGIEFDENGIPFVTRRTSGGTAKVTIDGEEVEIVSGGFIEVGNSRIYRTRGEKYTIVYAGEDGIVGDGDDQLVVDYMRPGTINIVSVYLGDEQKGNITGLLGNLNDNPDDDVALPDGTVLPRPLPFDRLYGDYREAYRIKDISESLFTYAEGQNPDTFYNPNFPEAPFTYANLDPEAKARGDAAALAAGYTPGTFEFESAAFDFAVTGDEGFLEGSETESQVTEALEIVHTVNQPPTITSNPNLSVSENTTTISVITAEDIDGDNLSFSISNGADQTLFTIDSNSGELTFNNAPDFETPADADADNNYQVQVSVTDGSETVTQDLTVSVSNVDEANNEVPTIDDAIFTVDENSASGTQVGIINATDPENEALIFAITSGNLDPDNDNNLAFAIDPLTGVITVNDSDDLDFEKNPSFNLEVTATDPGNSSAAANITVNLADKPSTQIETESNNGIFTLNGGDSTNVKFSLSNNDTEKVNEVGLFLVDDENGNVDGNTRGSDGYLKAALQRAQVIFSAISNRPSGFDLGDIERILEVDSDARFGFYLISDGTTDTALAELESTNTTNLPIFFSDSSNLQVSDLLEESFKLNWSDEIGNSDFTDMELSVQLTQDAPAPFTELQGEAQKELIDLRNETGQISVSVEVYREAAFDNLIGFYQVVDTNGGIDTNGDGTADFNPGDTGYEEAALTNRVTGLDLLQTDNQQTSTFDGILEGGNIFASFMVVDGTVDEAINNNAEVYFSFLGANSDGVDHIRLLGDNTFGYEDLPGGGDFDYNDMIVKVDFTTV